MDQKRVIYLLERYKQNELSDSEFQELDAWYQRFEQEPKDLHLQYVLEHESWAIRERIYATILGRIQISRKPVFILSVAASVTLLIATSILLYTNRFWVMESVVSATNITLSVPIGKVLTQQLPDGSTVWLRAGSELTYNRFFLGSERKVSLKGEAFFEVEKKPEKPFVVQSGGLSTRVLGTSFNVRALQELQLYEVMVRTGKVQVSQDDIILAMLTPNQGVKVVGSESHRLESIHLQDYLCWRGGGMSFNNNSLREIGWYLENRFGITLHISGLVGNCTFTGDFRDLSLHQILNIMQEVHPFEVRIIDEKELMISGNHHCK